MSGLAIRPVPHPSSMTRLPVDVRLSSDPVPVRCQPTERQVNVVLTDFLPADKVNPLADVSVIHGGQNTVMNACLSGTPIVGVGMHPEQQANLDACVRKGFAIRLNKKRVTAPQVLDAVDRLLRDDVAKLKVQAFRSVLQQWDGPAKATQVLCEILGPHSSVP